MRIYLINKKTFNKKSSGIREPCPYAKLSIDDHLSEFTSMTKIDTCNPIWDENFHFLIKDPLYEKLQIKIFTENDELCLTNIKISEITKEKNLTIDRKFDLKCNDTSCSPKINLVLRLRVFQMDKESESVVSTPSNTSQNNPLEESLSSSTTSSNKIEVNKQDELLRRRGPKQISKADSIDFGFGKIKLTIHYNLNESLFTVVVHSCK